MKMNILGEAWEVQYKTKKECPELKKIGGFCDFTIRTIVIRKQREESKPEEYHNLREYERCCLRHEIVHAFLFESGLAYDSLTTQHWAMNEEMVDWIARQTPKIIRAFQEAQAL